MIFIHIDVSIIIDVFKLNLSFLSDTFSSSDVSASLNKNSGLDCKHTKRLDVE